MRIHQVPPDTTGQIGADGQPVSVTNSVPGQNSRLTFAGAEGQRVGLLVDQLAYPASQHFAASIMRPDGHVLVAPTGLTSLGFLDTLTLPANGTYTVLLDPAAAGLGSARLRLYDVPADVSGTLAFGGSPASLQMSVPGQNGRLTFQGSVDAIAKVGQPGGHLPALGPAGEGRAAQGARRKVKAHPGLGAR